MTSSQRRQLIEKHQQGTLTDEESQQYLELLQNDPSFYDDVNMYVMLTDIAREDADQARWNTVTQSRIEVRANAQHSILPDSVRRYPYTYAMAASIALFMVVFWIFWPKDQSGGMPQLVKSEKRDVRLLTDSSKLGYDDLAGSVWMQWKQYTRQTVPQAYLFCRDTLTIFLKNPQDTIRWRSVRLHFSAKQQKLYISMPDKSILPLAECTAQPQSLPVLP